MKNLNDFVAAAGRHIKNNTTLLAGVVATLAVQGPIWALTANGTGQIGWEAPIAAVRSSISGPVAYGMGVVGIAVAGGSLLGRQFDWHHAGNTAVGVAVASGVAMAAPATLTAFFPTAGLLI